MSSAKYLNIVSYLKRKYMLAELLIVLVRLLKPGIFVSADEISTGLLESLDNYFQDTIVGGKVELVLDVQKLTLVERQGFH